MTLYSFYRPHPRVTEDNLYTDPITGEITEMPSMTKQEFQFECDINNVIKAFSQTGMFKHVSARAGQGAYEDLPDSSDFQEALHEVHRAREAFMTLPSKLRSRFGNDPAEFLAFTHDPNNLDELRSLGLANPAPLPPPPVVVTIAPTEGTGGDGGLPPVVGAKAP
ncbi:internal scaffolding protein [Blackfly microvirus SF02]|uniref:Internal scaffolding protein n=1 Tax=Blackfly microvirus SF02 TaxID=2576452 RepID=A0A4P8PJZ2_9VIRU|nr:internal scaffolding protein [Blackfly microvirus SF02]